MPFFSAVIPTYNREESLSRAIASVLSQTMKDYELIVVDDGSTDRTGELIDRTGGAVRYIRQENLGVSAARNRGISSTQGGHIVFLDSDDLWLPDKLERQYDYIRRNPDIRIHQTDELWIRRGRRVNPGARHRKRGGYIFADSLELCLISPSAVAMHRSLFDEYGLFDENLPACEDYDLWLRITVREQVGLIDRHCVVRHGGHEDQLSSRHWGMDRFRAYAILKLIASGALEPGAGLMEKALDVLMKKLVILRQGAGNRGKEDFARTIDDIIRKVRDGCCSSIDYRSLLAE